MAVVYRKFEGLPQLALRRTARRLRCTLPRRLALLQTSLLGGMLLLELLRLLRVALLQLLLLRVVVLVLACYLVFFFLLLLEPLVILRLPGHELVLLLLVLLVSRMVATVWRRQRVRLQFVRVYGGAMRTSYCARGIGWRRSVLAACLPGGQHASFEVSGSFGSGNGRLALID